MRARVVAAGRGASWVAQGWRLFRAAPLAWIGALFGALALLVLLGRVPLVGPPLFVFLVPALWVGFMTLARNSAGAGAESLQRFFARLREAAMPLALLGAVYFLANLGAVAATIPFGDSLLADWVFRGKAVSREVMASPAFMRDVLLSMFFYSPAMLAYWFCSVLAVWHGVPGVKALFFSLTACLLNWRAFTVYGLAVLGVFLGAVTLFSLGGGLLVAGAGVRPEFIAMVMLPVFAILVCVVVASAYASYVDVFGEPTATRDTGAEAD